MKKHAKIKVRLTLNRETLRHLDAVELTAAPGGAYTDRTCPLSGYRTCVVLTEQSCPSKCEQTCPVAGTAVCF